MKGLVPMGVVLSVLVWGIACNAEKRVSIPVLELVEGNGAPDLIATGALMVTETVDRLEIYVAPIDAWTFTNWQNLGDCVLVWLESPTARERARIYRPDLYETGSAYYIARARREHAKLYFVGTNGVAHKYARIKYESIGFRLDRTNSVVHPK